MAETFQGHDKREKNDGDRPELGDGGGVCWWIGLGKKRNKETQQENQESTEPKKQKRVQEITWQLLDSSKVWEWES